MYLTLSKFARTSYYQLKKSFELFKWDSEHKYSGNIKYQQNAANILSLNSLSPLISSVIPQIQPGNYIPRGFIDPPPIPFHLKQCLFSNSDNMKKFRVCLRFFLYIFFNSWNSLDSKKYKEEKLGVR